MRRGVLTVLAALAVLAVVCGVVVFLQMRDLLSGEARDRARHQSEAAAEDHARTFADRVRSESHDASGPADPQLRAIASGQVQVVTIERRPDLSLTVLSEASYPNLFGATHEELCFDIRFHRLATPNASYDFTRLPDCPPMPSTS